MTRTSVHSICYSHRVATSSSRAHPFGATEAVTTVRQYDASTGRLVRVFRPDDGVQFRRPRGLRFGPGGDLFCVAQDEVVGFDFVTGACLGALVRYPNLNGMALEFF